MRDFNDLKQFFNQEEKVLKELAKYKEQIKKSKTKEEAIFVLQQVYHFIKNITYSFLSTPSHFMRIINVLEDIEKEASLRYALIDTNPNRDLFSKIALNKNSSPEEILDYIVQETRFYLIGRKQEEKNLSYLNLRDRCKESSYKILEICKTIGIEAISYCVAPGFDSSKTIESGNLNYHYFIIINFDNKKYILDCTYAQFFGLGENVIEKLGILEHESCYPGVYMIMNDSRRKTALSLINRGWVEMTKENFLNYMDGFALTWRNGLYYEKIKKAIYTTKYSEADYVNFLYGIDSQSNHEDIESLGKQRKPLKNPNFKF